MRIDEQTIKADAKRCWDALSASALREEFGDYARYESWRLAAARGSVRVMGARVREDGEIELRAPVIS